MRLPDVAPNTEVADFGDELVVLVPGRRRAIHLSAGHALVFDSCRNRSDLDELVAELTSTGSASAADVRSWVRATLVELARHGAIAPIDDSVSAAGEPTP